MDQRNYVSVELTPLPVVAMARILFNLMLLSLLSPAYSKELRRDKTAAGKAAAV